MKLAIIVSQLLVASAWAKDCTDVSVEGDGTFCIKGPICAGKDKNDGQYKCPQIGDATVADCRPSNPSYNKATGKCVAPVPAECLLLDTGAYGCVWDLSYVPEPVKTPAPPAGCEKVSVVGDGTFCIKGPVCSGTDEFDGNEYCPQIGDTAVEACVPTNPSYNKATGKCVAPVPSECRLLPTGAYGCVWDLSKLPVTNTTAPTPAPSTPIQTTKAPTPAPTTPAKDCTDVSVEGDGTFCIKGPICAGKDKNDGQYKCPQIGDATVADCRPSNPSYNKATGKCVAPVPAECLLLDTGAYGCVWDLSYVPEPVKTPAPPAGCEKVSVVGDGTFCIKGPVCSGTDKYDGNEYCPQIGDTAVEACVPTNPSYSKATGKCVAPVPSECRLLPTGAYGCVWDLSKLPVTNTTAPTPAPSTPIQTTKAPTPAPTTKAPTPTTKAPTPTTTQPNNQQTKAPEFTVAPGCTDVKVVGDATFCIMGPICEGTVYDDGKENCPKAGDYAVDACYSTSPSYDPKTQYCRAPVDAQCLLQDSGEYKCAWPTTTQSVSFNAAAVTGASAAGASTGIIVGAIAAVAAVGIAVVGTIMYKKHAKKQAAAHDEVRVEVALGATPRSPEFRGV